jgi:hypothetical protein
MKPTANNSRHISAARLRFLFWMILVGLLSVRALAAQDNPHPRQKRDDRKLTSTENDSTRKHIDGKSYWFDLGLGWGGQGNGFDIGFTYEVAPARIMSLRYSGVRTSARFYDYAFLFPVANYPDGEDAGAVELTYGFLKKGKAGLMNFSAGLSVVRIHSGISHGPSGGYDIILFSSDLPADYRLEEIASIGLVLRAQIIPSFRWGGLGLSPSVNINPDYTFAALTIQLALGKMRAKQPRRLLKG